MTKHARKSPRLQPAERPPAATVQIPLPVLGAFASIERSYFALCIRAGQHVLDAMMEQDRTELCGPRWKRDPDRQAGRAGTTPSEVTLRGRRIQLTRWLTTPLGDRHFTIVLIDGIILGDHTVVIALGIDTEGKKQVLGLREGHTEHRRVVKALLRDLVERGLDPERARLFVIDGAKALASAIRTVCGTLGVIQRCQLHKRRNILGHLPDHLHANVTAVLREAWTAGDVALAHRQLERLAASLETDHPGAATLRWVPRAVVWP